MSLDIYLKKMMPIKVYEANITYNLNKMAESAGIYKYLWRPEEINITKANQLIKPLKKAIKNMEKKPDYYKTFNASNGWGTYDQFLPWLKKLLQICKENPDAEISVSR